MKEVAWQDQNSLEMIVCIDLVDLEERLTLSLPSATPVALKEFTVRYQARLQSRCCSKFSINVMGFLVFFSFFLFLSPDVDTPFL